MTHIMLDLETWGKRPGCDIRSIGAVVFDPITGWVSARGSVGTFYIALDNPDIVCGRYRGKYRHKGAVWHWDGIDAYRKYQLVRDPETVKWWSEQSAEAQAAFADPIDLAQGLKLFATWVDQHCIDHKQLRIWAHGSHFDIPILAAAYHAVEAVEPWHYRSPRDTRTVFDDAGVDDHCGFMALFSPPGGIIHHALDDALCQASAVCAAKRVIKTDVRLQSATTLVNGWFEEYLASSEPGHWGEPIDWRSAKEIARRIDNEGISP